MLVRVRVLGLVRGLVILGLRIAMQGRRPVPRRTPRALLVLLQLLVLQRLQSWRVVVPPPSHGSSWVSQVAMLNFECAVHKGDFQTPAPCS